MKHKKIKLIFLNLNKLKKESKSAGSIGSKLEPELTTGSESELELWEEPVRFWF